MPNATDHSRLQEVHDCLNGLYDGYGRTPFILSLDGGGIYGLTEAIWLRKLCEKIKGFLVPGQVRIFAGTSAGALNALLLAMHESPREAVLAGELERFWTKSGILSNDAPLSRLTGSRTAMYGAQDAIGALEDVFGDMTLGDLWPKRKGSRVLVSTFNYTGGPTAGRPFGTPFEHSVPNWTMLRPSHVFRMGPRTPVENPKAGQTVHHWRPKFFDNHGLVQEDKDIKLVDLAMAAICLPGIRPFRGGLGDGGLMSADPSVGAIAHLLRQWELCVDLGLGMAQGAPRLDDSGAPMVDADGNVIREPLSPRAQIHRILADGDEFGSKLATSGNRGTSYEDWNERVPEERLEDADWVKTTGKGVLLSWIKLLSVGPGQALPSYGYANMDIGMNLAQQLPFNPFDRNIWPQSMYSLDQPSSGAEYTCSRLLDEHRFLRLDPDVMRLPTLAAAMMTNHPLMRSLIIREIYKRTAGAKSENAVDVAADFLTNQPKNPVGIWGTDWYYDGVAADGRLKEGRGPGQRERLRRWQAERDAREAERRRRQPIHPWARWVEYVQERVRKQ